MSTVAILALVLAQALAQRPSDAPWTLTYAISHRQASVVDMLLKLGVPANLSDGTGSYPLDLAARKGDAQIVRMLLERGAKVDTRSKIGTLPIHTAALSGYAEIVKLLLDKGSEIDCRVTGTGETPIYYAASFGRTSTVELLLERGADASIPDARGVTPLAAARKAEQTEAANLLQGRARH